MRLSSIKMAGFKSFVDPTTFHAPTNLIGVVGPNGDGTAAHFGLTDEFENINALEAVPEPAGLVAFVTGLVGLVMRRRSRRKTS